MYKILVLNRWWLLAIDRLILTIEYKYNNTIKKCERFRELFYQNVIRFRNQSNVDVAVRDACCLLERPPWELGLIATAKGLIAGPLHIETSDGKNIDCLVSGGMYL